MKMLDATIVMQEPGGLSVKAVRFLKYHNIQNTEPAIKNFIKFAVRKGKELHLDPQYVNFYDAEGEKRYQFRRYCS